MNSRVKPAVILFGENTGHSVKNIRQTIRQVGLSAAFFDLMKAYFS